MFNFFKRKKSPGEEKKKRGVQKERKKSEELESAQSPRREATGARSVRESGAKPDSTAQTFGTGVLPKPSVVGPPSPGPIDMGNDYSQPLNSLQNNGQIPCVDQLKGEHGSEIPQLGPPEATAAPGKEESDKSSVKSVILNETKQQEVPSINKCKDSSTELCNFDKSVLEFKPSVVNPIDNSDSPKCASENSVKLLESKQQQVPTNSTEKCTELCDKIVLENKPIFVNPLGSVSSLDPDEAKIALKKSVNLNDIKPQAVPDIARKAIEEPTTEVENPDNSVLGIRPILQSEIDSSDNERPIQNDSKSLEGSDKREHVDAKNIQESNIVNNEMVIDHNLSEINNDYLPNFELCSEINAKNDSEFEKNLTSNGRSLANETKEEKSVTDDVGAYLARRGLASCQEYSSGSSPETSSNQPLASPIDVTATSGGEMHRVGSYPQRLEDGLNCAETYDRLKNGASENVYGLESNGQLAKSAGETNLYQANERCDETKSESDETSEDESSECEDSDSDNVIKNDSGCWDERDGSIFLSESDNQVTTTASLCSLSSILRDGSFREKKHVKWADIDGKTDLTHEKENLDTFVEESSSEEEETEDEEEDGEENSGSEETESDEEEEKTIEEVKVPVADTENDYKREDTWLDMKASSEEDSEEEEEEILPVAEKIEEEKEETSESEEESSQDESSEEEQVKDEEPKILKIDIAEMHNRIAELQKDVNMKATNIDRLQVELDAACNESELVRQRFKRLEADLEAYKQANKELLDRIQVTEHTEVEKVNKSHKHLEAAERRIQQLEAELQKVKLEYSNLQSSYKKLQADRDMEVQIIQKALEKALTGQEEMEAKYEQEFEKLRTLNSSREVQMLEDFEWKLREVERNCKKKMQEYESEFEKRSYELANQLAAAQADLEQISHLKLCEIELNQLKQTSSEQRKNLRTVNRKFEELQVSEKILQEEVNSLRSSLDKEKAHIVTLQALHKDELADKEKKMRLKLEYQIQQLTNEWEERLRRENNKIKTELERISREEKMVAVDLASRLKDKEIAQLKQNWEKKAQEFKDEIDKYKSKLTNIEEQRRYDLDKAQTNADRDLFDLRRKMDKLDMSYQEKIEKIQEQHEAELDAVKEDCDKRVQQSEANLQLQIGNSRATLELVKQQLRNEAQAKIEKLENEYKQKLEQQWNALKKEKDSAIDLLEEKHQKALENIYKEIEKTKKQARNDQDSLTRKRSQPPTNQPMRQGVPQQKNKCHENDSGHSPNHISGRLDVADVAEEIRVQGKEEVLQRSIEQLTRQLNAGKMEIEKLRQQLEVRETRQQQQQQQPSQNQQRNAQQPVANPRRNRKGRGGDCYVQ